jgi:type III restriction enzyme
MPLHPDFPTDPHVILDPAIRWYPGDAMLADLGYEMLLPPLVHKVRRGVKSWRCTATSDRARRRLCRP